MQGTEKKGRLFRRKKLFSIIYLSKHAGQVPFLSIKRLHASNSDEGNHEWMTKEDQQAMREKDEKEAELESGEEAWERGRKGEIERMALKRPVDSM